MNRGQGMPYAWICEPCRHPLNRHGLTVDGDVREGPYVCRECGCSIKQDDPAFGIWGEDRYVAYMVSLGMDP